MWGRGPPLPTGTPCRWRRICWGLTATCTADGTAGFPQAAAGRGEVPVAGGAAAGDTAERGGDGSVLRGRIKQGVPAGDALFCSFVAYFLISPLAAAVR